MKSAGLILLLVLLPPPALAQNTDGYHYEPAVGWYWYNRPPPEEEAGPLPWVAMGSPDSATSRMQRLRAFRDNLMNEAILSPTPEHIRRYKIVQDWMVDQASRFAARWEKVLLEYPGLDYSLKHPFYHGAAAFQSARRRQKQQAAIHRLHRRFGVFFFYRGAAPLDQRLGDIVKAFSAQYDLPVVAVSIDGHISPTWPDSRHDSGQADNMGIPHFPALYLVDPQTKRYQPLAYGFITQDDLARRMLNVVTDFAPED